MRNVRTLPRYRDPPHADEHAHTYAFIYNVGRELCGRWRRQSGREEDKEKIELTRALEQCMGASSPSPSCVSKRVHDSEGCAPYVHTETLINAYR